MYVFGQAGMHSTVPLTEDGRREQGMPASLRWRSNESNGFTYQVPGTVQGDNSDACLNGRITRGPAWRAQPSLHFSPQFFILHFRN
jgi:hypothetical protein